MRTLLGGTWVALEVSPGVCGGPLRTQGFGGILGLCEGISGTLGALSGIVEVAEERWGRP